MKLARLACLVVTFQFVLAAQHFYTYVGNIGPTSVLIAWGTADGVNTIGRSSPSHGEATIKMAGQTYISRANWTVVGGLKPDTEYPYQVSIRGTLIGQGSVRTWPETATRLVFFVIGDYGNGSRTQYAIARAMWDEFVRRAGTNNPVRFILSMGDNIYGDINNVVFGAKNTGNEDKDWDNKFFRPYQALLGHIPFYPTLGNHDGNESENRGDLNAYLDNFFFPSDQPSRYYKFSFANLADFFGLDTTLNTESGPARAGYLPGSPQFKWMQDNIPASTAPWKIPYFHHPPFNGGPRHPSSLRDLSHWVQLFRSAGVKVTFSGHEHNFQFSENNDATGGIQFVVSGAGGELRTASIVGSRMRKNHIAGFSAENHFLVVEIDGKTMRITPLGFEPIVVVGPDGNRLSLPLVVNLP